MDGLPRLEWQRALKALGGFALGILLWMLLTPVYDRVLAASASAVIRISETPPVTRLRQAPDGYVTVDRSDFDPRSKRPAVPVRDLTFNFVLLTALFAASRRVVSDRNIGGFLIGSAALALTHILALIVTVKNIYASQLGAWSRVHYSAFERNLWGVTNHFYRLVLMYAIAFGLWWLFRDRGSDTRSANRSKPARTASRPKKR